ncbi:hypothetical protein MNBD_NITROSPINAE02-1052 [hydrothermal vent metagenome]|uniref:Uncharacterized protein n=1 Tax=hydrothermal vent metagenome TaxID=652676 RepID=A0A3B1BJX9_9ZZZZ
MKHLKPLICFLASLIFLSSSPTLGQSQIAEKYFHLASSLRLGDLASNPELKIAFKKLRSALEKEDELEVFNQNNRILEIMNLLGTRNLFPVADMCMAIGRAALARGEKTPAILAAESATKFAPDYAKAHFFLASALLSSDAKNINSISRSLIEGIKILYSDRIQRDSLVSAIFKYVFLALVLMFVLTFVVLLGLHLNTFAADLASFFPSRVEGAWRYFITALVIAVPFALGGGLALLLAIPLFLWPYLRTGGKVTIFLFTLFMLLVPHVFDYMAKSSAITKDKTFRALHILSRQTWDYSSKSALENAHQKNPDSKLVSFSLGLLNKLRKDKREAINAYDAVLERYPQDVKTIVNKGNVYFVAREYENAVKMYKMAIDIDPQLLEAHFNLSNTYVMMFRTGESEAEYLKALSIDQNRVQSFVAMAGQNHDKKVIDFTITGEDIKRYESAMGEKAESFSQTSWGIYFGSISMRVYQWMTIGFALLIIFSHFFWRRSISHQTCISCGVAFRPPLLLPSNKQQCNQCVAANISRVGIPSAKKDRKTKDIRVFKERRAKLAGLMDRLLPGMGRTYFQEHASAMAFTFITSLIIVYGADLFISEYLNYKSAPKDALHSNVIYLGVASVYWIMMNTVLKKDFY